MSIISTVRDKVRAVIEDIGESTHQSFTYVTSAIFTLNKTNTYQITQVTVNGLDTTNYTFNSDNVTVTVNDSLSEDDIITVYFDYYEYSNTQIEKFIDYALMLLSVNKYSKTENDKIYRLESGNEIYPYPDENDKNLMAVIAGILIKPNYSQYRTPTVTVNYPREEDKHTKIRKLIFRYKSSLGYCGVISL